MQVEKNIDVTKDNGALSFSKKLPDELTNGLSDISLCYHPRVLVVDDEEHVHNHIKLIISKINEKSLICPGLRSTHVFSIQEALSLLKRESFNLIILDREFKNANEGEISDGIEAICEIKKLAKTSKILIYSGRSNLDGINDAFANGAAYYLTKNVASSVIAHKLHHFLLSIDKDFRLKNVDLFQSSNSPKNIPGCSSAIKYFRSQAREFSENKSSILLEGETGVGKTQAGRYIHSLYSRYFRLGKNSPFIEFSVKEIADTLLESELFGHKRGSFTDATSDKIGKLVAANGGIIFFDEIGDASHAFQDKILKFVEDKSVMRVGDTKKVDLDVKLVFATNKNLQKLVQEGKFREDLYYRISALKLEIPPLRERIEDIPEVFKAVLPKIEKQLNLKVSVEKIPDSFYEYLKTVDLSGNYRSIESIVMNIFLMLPKDRDRNVIFTRWKKNIHGNGSSFNNMKSKVLTETDFSRNTVMSSFLDDDFISLKEFLEASEKKIIIEALKKFKTKTDLSKFLGIHVTSLYTKLKKHGIDSEKFKASESK